MYKGLSDIEYKKTIFSNGMVVIVIPKYDTKLVALSLLYRTGSKDESPEKTGMAHLMEHLMFSGTPANPKFDIPLSRVGGVNNAFTNQDVTNYHLIVPAEHLSLALELEADRMFNLPLDEERVLAEKRVVIEEFRQRYLNQPYGDLFHFPCQTAYSRHPYRWPTIGYSTEHIEAITAQEARSFYQAHYQPSNLIMTIAGNVSPDDALQKVESIFGSLPSSDFLRPTLPQEPVKGRQARVVVHKEVPASGIIVSYPISSGNHPDQIAFSFLADILGSGVISRFYDRLVRQKLIFTGISAGTSGSVDPGLFNIKGMLCDGVDSYQAIVEVIGVIEDFIARGPTTAEMKSVINGMLTSMMLQRQNIASLALEVAKAELEGDANKVNELFTQCKSVDADQLTRLVRQYFMEDNRIEIHYLSKK